jgi:hypothetical protein
VPFHPKLPELRTFGHELVDALHFRRAAGAGETVFTAVDHPRFLGPERVHEERRMGGDHELGHGRCRPALLRQFRQQPGMELVLGLLDADQLGRVRVMEQGEIGEHLQRAVGGEFRHDRFLERGVLHLQEQAAVGHYLGVDLLQLGNALGELLQHEGEPLVVLFLQILNDVGQLSPVVLRRSCGPASGTPRVLSAVR